MATLWGIYAESWSIEIANNEDQYVTADWEFDIVPFVEAHTALTAFSHSGGGSTVTSGLIECTTRDPATGIDTMNTIGSLNRKRCGGNTPARFSNPIGAYAFLLNSDWLPIFAHGDDGRRDVAPGFASKGWCLRAGA